MIAKKRKSFCRLVPSTTFRNAAGLSVGRRCDETVDLRPQPWLSFAPVSLDLH
jgi:hypothetical protein